ncbi:MAG: hypothetical protein JNM88_09760 [Chitinophagaceae bacterium]|nr:hypothetical protein [Chitinophagaceae bacterium]
MANSVPLTLINSTDGSTVSVIYLGNQLTPHLPDYKVTLGSYWYVVLDRSSLAVAASFQTTDTSNVPQALNPYLNNPQYLLIVLANSISTGNSGPPDGNLYAFFQEMGSSAALAELEQVIAATGSGTFGVYAYTLVAIMDGSACFDFVLYNAPPETKPYALQLIPLDNLGGGSFYTPQKLNGV